MCEYVNSSDRQHLIVESVNDVLYKQNVLW
jgi:hypothetical protein